MEALISASVTEKEEESGGRELRELLLLSVLGVAEVEVGEEEPENLV